MRCPVCEQAVLEVMTLPEGLAAKRCAACEGHWIEHAAYWKWREGHPPMGAGAGGAGVPPRAQDSGAGKLCPNCSAMLIRWKVGHGLDFYLDRCGHCGGIWFDGQEWQAIAAKNMQERVHLIFSEDWQSDVLRQEHRAAHDKLFAKLLGESDLAKVKQFKQWLDGHPRRSELYAYLEPGEMSAK